MALLIQGGALVTTTISAQTHHSRCDRLLYQGFRLRGAVKHVIASGEHRFVDGELRVNAGDGRYI